MARTKPLKAKQVAQLGDEVYEKFLRPKLEPKHTGKLVAIEVQTHNFFIGDTLTKQSKRAEKSTQIISLIQ